MFQSINAQGEILVESSTRGFQRHPELAALGRGFCVTWTDDTLDHCDVGGPDVRAKLFGASGEALSEEFLVNSETIDHQRDPKVAGLANGYLLVIWQDFSGRGGDDCGSGLKAKLFDGSGRVIRDEFLVNLETLGRQFNASAAALDGGNFVVVWQTGAAGSSCVMARVFTEAGDPLGTDILVDINSQAQSDHPIVAATRDGGFTVVWSERSVGPHGPLQTLKARRFTSNGSPRGDELLVNPDAVVDQTQLSAVGLSDGGFVVAWAEITDPSPFVRLACRVFDADGNASGGLVEVSDNALDRAHSAALAALDDGAYVLVWTQRNGPGHEIAHSIRAAMLGQRGVSSQAFSIGNPVRDQGNPAVIAIANGGFAVAWEEMTGNSSGTCVKAQLFLPAQ